MLNPRHLLRMSRLARNRPSEARFKLIIAVVLICLLLLGYEHFFGWPDALSPASRGRIQVKPLP